MNADHRAWVYGLALAVFVLAVIVDLAKPKWRLTVNGIIAFGLALVVLVPLVDSLKAI